MIIFGSKSKKLKPKKTNIISPKDSDGIVIVSGLRKYFHIYFLPFFGTSTDWFLYCSETEKIISENEVASDQNRIDEIKKSYGRGVWRFTGLFIFILLSILVYSALSKKSDEYSQYFESPKLGDVYKIKNNNYYSFLRLDIMENDSYFFRPSKYKFNSKGARRADKSNPEIYVSDLYKIYSQKELNDLYENKIIKSIYRPVLLNGRLVIID